MRKFWKKHRIVGSSLLFGYGAWLGWQINKNGGLPSEVFLWMLGIGLVIMLVDLFQRRDQVWSSKRPEGDLRDG